MAFNWLHMETVNTFLRFLRFSCWPFIIKVKLQIRFLFNLIYSFGNVWISLKLMLTWYVWMYISSPSLFLRTWRANKAAALTVAQCQQDLFGFLVAACSFLRTQRGDPRRPVRVWIYIYSHITYCISQLFVPAKILKDVVLFWKDFAVFKSCFKGLNTINLRQVH